MSEKFVPDETENQKTIWDSSQTFSGIDGVGDAFYNGGKTELTITGSETEIVSESVFTVISHKANAAAEPNTATAIVKVTDGASLKALTLNIRNTTEMTVDGGAGVNVNGNTNISRKLTVSGEGTRFNAGFLTVSGLNGYTGKYADESGVLNVQDHAVMTFVQMTVGFGDVIIDSATLQNTPGSVVEEEYNYGASVSENASLTISNNGNLVLGGETNTAILTNSGKINIIGGTLTAKTVSIEDNGEINVSGNSTINAKLAGTGVLTLDGGTETNPSVLNGNVEGSILYVSNGYASLGNATAKFATLSMNQADDTENVAVLVIGKEATLTTTSGSSSFRIGNDTAGSNTVIVDGGTVKANHLTVRDKGALTLQNGAIMSSGETVLRGKIKITGAGTVYTVAQTQLYRYNEFAEMEISDGARYVLDNKGEACFFNIGHSAEGWIGYLTVSDSTIETTNGTFCVNNGSFADFANSVLTTAKTVTVTGKIMMDATSSITAGTLSITGTGSLDITIDLNDLNPEQNRYNLVTISGSEALNTENITINGIKFNDAEKTFGDYSLILFGNDLILTTEDQSIFYVDAAYTPENAGGHIYGYNAFSAGADAIGAVTADTTKLLFAGGTSDYGKTIISSSIEVGTTGDGYAIFTGSAETLDFDVDPSNPQSIDAAIASGAKIKTSNLGVDRRINKELDESITAKLTIKDSAEVLVSEEGAAAGHIWNRKGSELVIEKNAKVALYGEFQNKGTVTVSGTLELNAAGGLGMALGGSGTPAGDKTDKGMMYIDGGSVSYTGNTWISIGGYTSSAPGQRVKEDGSLLSISNKGMFTVKTVDTFRVYDGATMALAGLSTVDIEKGLLNEGTVNVVGSTLKAGTITNKKTINVTGTSTLTGAIAGSGNTNFGAADSSVSATFNMTGLNGGFVAVANGSLDIYGTNEESSSEVIVVGGGWDHDPFANGVASGTLNITKDSTLYFNQIRIGDRNDAGNIHRVNIDGKALQRVDPVKEQGGTVWLRYNGELNVRAGGELTVRQISNGGVISVEAATVTVNGKVEVGSKASAGNRAGQISLTENSTMTVTGDFNLGFQDDELRNGELTVNNSTLTIDGVLKVGESDSADPDKTVAGHGVLKLVNTQKVTVGSITVSSGSSIELDYSSTLIFNIAFSNSGTITVDMTGVTATGIYKLVDSKNTDMTLADYGNVVFKDGADNGYTLSVIDNDLFVSKIDIGTLYVNRDWAGKRIGEEVEENSGKFYGINAFDNMDKIYSKVMNGGVARVELSSDVSFVKRDPKIDEYGFFFKDDVVIGSDGDTQRVISSNGQVDLVIVGADQSRGSGNAKPSITIEENIRIQSAGAVWFGYYLAGNGSTYPQYLGNYAADITLKGDVELTAGQAHIFGRGTVMTVAETGSVTVAKSDIQTRGAKLIVNGTGKDMASAQIQLNHQNVEGDTASYIEGEFYDTASAAWELNNTFVNVNTFFGINTAGDSSVSPDRASGIDATVTLNNSKLAVGTNLTMADSAKIILNSESVMTVGGDVKLGNAAAVSKGAEISISGGSSFEAVGTVTLKEGATGITVAGSTLKAGSIANAGTITVSGTSSLTIGALTGVISIADGSVLTGTSVSGGTILSSGSITVNSEAFTGSTVTISGSLNITDVVLPSGTDSVTLLGSAVAASAITVNGSLVNNNSFVVDGVKYNVVDNGSSLTVSMDQVAPYVPMEFAGTPAVSQEAGSYNFTIGGFTVTGGEGGITYKVVVKNGDTVVAESNGLSFSLADIPTYDSISITLTASDKFGESTKLVIMDQAANAVADYTAPVIGAYGISQQSGKDVYTFSVTVEATDNFGSDGLVTYYRYASTVEGLANAETLTVGELKLTAADAGKTYYYQMMAKDKAGNETAWTTEASFAVADVTDPTVTGSVIVQGADNYSFTVSADATDNVGVEKLVYRWAETEAGLSGEGVAITETLIVGEQTQSFYYQVQAFDKAGNASGWTTAEKVDVNDVTAPVITESSITRISGTYSFSVVVDGTDNFGVTERLYRFAATEDGLADSQWLSITTPLALSAADAERTYYYQVMLKDAAGNESYSGAPTSFRVDQIPVEGEAIVIVPEVRTDESGKQYSKTEDVKGTVSKETDTVVKYQIANDIASQTSVALDGLDKGEKVKVTIYDESGKKLKTATVTANKNGQAVVKDFLAPSGKINMVVESTTRKGEVDYTMSVEQNYFKAASANTDLNSSVVLLADDASETASGWVGYGDSVDTYRISTGDYAAALDLNFTSLESKVKISLRDENGKKIKSMTLTAKNYDRKSFSDILVDAGKTTYLYVESTSGKKNLSADYTLTTSKEEFANATNDSMLNRTGAGVFVDGVSSNKGWVGYSDAADYFQFEITSAQSVGFDLADLTDGYKAGKQVKFALYDLKTNKKVSLSSVKNSSADWITKKELEAGKYCAVVSISNEKKYRTDYSLNILANS